MDWQLALASEQESYGLGLYGSDGDPTSISFSVQLKMNKQIPKLVVVWRNTSTE